MPFSPLENYNESAAALTGMAADAVRFMKLIFKLKSI
jgi:hypothetical protein